MLAPVGAVSCAMRRVWSLMWWLGGRARWTVLERLPERVLEAEFVRWVVVKRDRLGPGVEEYMLVL